MHCVVLVAVLVVFLKLHFSLHMLVCLGGPAASGKDRTPVWCPRLVCFFPPFSCPISPALPHSTLLSLPKSGFSTNRDVSLLVVAFLVLMLVSHPRTFCQLFA